MMDCTVSYVGPRGPRYLVGVCQGRPVWGAYDAALVLTPERALRAIAWLQALPPSVWPSGLHYAAVLWVRR